MKVDAHELKGTKVNLVSIVEKAASRLPFRITKSEDEMSINLFSLFKKDAAIAAVTPSVFAAVLRKGADVEKFKAALTKAGMVTDKMTENDTAIFFAQKDGDPSVDSVLIKSNDDYGFVVEGLEKAFSGYDFNSPEFTDVFATGSFCPSISMAGDLLSVTIGNILQSCESPTDAGVLIGKACDGFKGYCVTLANSLPVNAFKADAAMSYTGSASSSHQATLDDAKGTAVNNTKPKDKPLADSENMKGITVGMKKPNAGPQGTGVVDFTPNDPTQGTTAGATSNDKTAVFQKKAEQVADLRKQAGVAAAANDHVTAATLYKAAGKLEKANAATSDNDDGTDAAGKAKAKKIADSQSGAGAQGSNSGANVSKTEEEKAADLKKAEAQKAVDVAKAALVAAEALLKDSGTGVGGSTGDNNLTANGGTSAGATADDANNTAVGATKKKPDPNLEGPDGMDANGWTSKIAGEVSKAVMIEVNKSLTAVAATVEGVRKEVTGLAGKVTEVSEQARKAEEAVSGTVIAEPGRELTGLLGRRKAEVSNGEIPTLDTAFQKRERVNVHDIREHVASGRR